jgi:hypothetical protein
MKGRIMEGKGNEENCKGREGIELGEAREVKGRGGKAKKTGRTSDRKGDGDGKGRGNGGKGEEK